MFSPKIEIHSILTWLNAHEDFLAFTHGESFNFFTIYVSYQRDNSRRIKLFMQQMIHIKKLLKREDWLCHNSGS
jgi:hypothetical protein